MKKVYYTLKGYWFRFKRACSWFVFSIKQHPWQEDYQLFETIEKVLLDTATYFENREKKGYVVGVDNNEDVADMRLAARLIRMRINEHYMEEVSKTEDNNVEPEEREYDFPKRYAAMQKDQRALQIAMNIIAEKGFHWWI